MSTRNGGIKQLDVSAHFIYPDVRSKTHRWLTQCWTAVTQTRFLRPLAAPLFGSNIQLGVTTHECCSTVLVRFNVTTAPLIYTPRNSGGSKAKKRVSNVNGAIHGSEPELDIWASPVTLEPASIFAFSCHLQYFESSYPSCFCSSSV